jgi:hypothetical protein
MQSVKFLSIALFLATGTLHAAPVTFATKPSAGGAGDPVKITFAVSAPTDVEVCILDAQGKEIRHLAAGVLGAKNPPPAPFVTGLAQEILWDRKDDFKQPAANGPFQVRVRIGTSVKFSRFLGSDDPYSFGTIQNMAVSPGGDLFVLGWKNEDSLGATCLRQFAPDGRYLRTLLPFPADLPPGAMKDVASWDEEDQCFRPVNYCNMNPSFYLPPANARCCPLRLLAVVTGGNVLLSNGALLYELDARGAVVGDKAGARHLWPQDPRPGNWYGGPIEAAESPDGEWLYLSGYFSQKAGPYFCDTNFPLGVVYRMKLRGTGRAEPFIRVPVEGEWAKTGGAYQAYGIVGISKGPIHGLAVDAAGNIYLADRERNRVSQYSKDGRELEHVDIPMPDKPDRVAVNPQTGALYVLVKSVGGFNKSYPDGSCFGAKLLKFDRIKAGAAPSVVHDFGLRGKDVADNMQMAATFAGGKARLWISVAAKYELQVFEDKGATFEPVETEYRLAKDSQWGWSRLATDWERDEVYGLDGAVGIWRYDGKTGKGERVQKSGKPLLSQDLAVGYDGLLYVREGNGAPEFSDYSGPFSRYTRDLQPAPFAGIGTHVLSKYIYSREGPGYAEKGIGISPDGRIYISWQFLGFGAYSVTGFGPDGRPLPGRYNEGKGHDGNYKYGTPTNVTSAIIGLTPEATGGVRVDLDGNIYLGLWNWPATVPAPAKWAMNEAYMCSVGSVFKFGPGGGQVTEKAADGTRGIEARTGSRIGPALFGRNFIEGAVAAYPGLAPFSHASFGVNSCCTCRTPRFDVDRYGRIYMPNAIANTVVIVDNAGNEILTFGKYGNFDSAFVNPNLPAGKAGKPTVAVPEIPLAWPVAAGVTKDAIYVADYMNRRGVRVERRYAAEESCAVR